MSDCSTFSLRDGSRSVATNRASCTAAFIFRDRQGVIAGSSNFTVGGLTSNLELNLGQYQPIDEDAVALAVWMAVEATQ